MKRNLVLLLLCIITSIPSTLLSQSFFTVEKNYPCKGCGPYSIDLSKLTVYSEAEANNIFNEIYNSGITFTYPQGGCQQRAEIMHLLLQNKFHVSHGRIWLFAPTDLLENGTVLLKLQDPNHLIAGDTIMWGYHVAPFIMVKDIHGIVSPMIIDPALYNSGPASKEIWFSKMKNHELASYTFLDSQWYFFNTQKDGASKVINGYFYTYGAVANNKNTNYDRLVLERELAINDVAMYIKEAIDKGSADPNGNFKALLSDVEKMINFFSPQERCNPTFAPIIYRQIFYDNTKLASDMVTFYNQRFLYWVNMSKQMNL